MPYLKLTCLGPFDARLDDQPVAFRSMKGRALLIYLAVERHSAQPLIHPRTTLAGLLWPDEPEPRARKNLSQTLLEVRRALGDRQTEPPFFQSTNQSLALHPKARIRVDVDAFRQALDAGDYAIAVDLYQGEFLTDFALKESTLFDEWLLTTRQVYAQQALDAYAKLGATQEADGSLDGAIITVRSLLALAPWQEEAHRQLMRLLAQTGQRSAALAQYDTLSQMLMDELGVPPAAETDVLYDQILAGEISTLYKAPLWDAALANSLPDKGRSDVQHGERSAPFQATAPPPHFVGRQRELDQLCTSLAHGGTPIHAIVGMGGIGKSTLASQTAHRLRPDFRDGVLWGNPASSSLLDILATWASAYGFDFSAMTDVQSRAATVRGVLAEKNTLIVLDNVERVGSDGQNVQALLPNSRGCAVLITTRDLDVAHALNAEALLLGELTEANTEHLLAEIVGAERVRREGDAVREIGRLLSNLPLAVELAAQRLKSRPRMKLAQMAARLGDQQARLGLGISDRAVRASFAVSWDALDADLRSLFPLLALFERRSFTAEAVAHLADLSPFEAEEALYTLEALSLVRAAEPMEAAELAGEAEIAAARFALHPLLADFAHEKLVVQDALERTTTRYSDYYLGFVTQHEEAHEQLETEWGNLLAAMGAAHGQARWQRVLHFAERLTLPWQTRARYDEARQGYGWAVEAATHLADDVALAVTLLRWGQAALEQNHYEEAQKLLERSLHAYMTLEEDAGIANVYYNLAIIALERGEYAPAGDLLHKSLTVFTAIQDEAGTARVQLEQSRIHYELTELDAAETLATTALATINLATQRHAADPLLASSIYRHMTIIALKRGLLDQARFYAERALELCTQSGDEGELMAILYTTAAIDRDQKRYASARENAEAGLKIAERCGFLRYEGLLHMLLARTTDYLGERSQALDHIRRARILFSDVADPRSLTLAVLLLSSLLDDPAEKERARSEALDIARQSGNASLVTYAMEFS